MDGVHFLTLPADHNVALLAEEGQALVVLGTEKVRQDLGPSRRLDPASVAALPDRLREVFTEASGVRAFLESSVHPSFAPSPDHQCVRGEFAPGIDSWFCIGIAAGRPRLDCAVLAKLSDASRRIVREPVWRRAPPAGIRSASGTSFGPYDVTYDRDRNVLWIDGGRQHALQEAHVLLFSETNGSLELVGTIALERDSASPLKSLRDVVMSSSVFHEFAKREI